MKSVGRCERDLAACRRRLRMLVQVLREGIGHVSEMAKVYDVHVNSVRGDLEYLSSMGDMVKVLSPEIVVSLVPVFANPKLQERLSANCYDKWLVAKKAAELVENGDSVFLGGGGTAFLLALEIALGRKHSISVVSGVLYVQHLLRMVSRSKIIAGTVAKDNAVVEADVGASLSGVPIEKAFMGVEGCSWERGAYCSRINVDIQQSACAVATKLIVIMADHQEMNKYDRGERFVSFQELEDQRRPYVVICNADGEHYEPANSIWGFPPGRVKLV